jgi:tetratricopeptide (TPR) repeat protein
MDIERMRKVAALVDELFDLAPAERSRRLAKACGDDADLEAEVTAMLDDAYESAADAVAQPAIAAATAALAELNFPTRTGRRVGAWVLEEEIGRGGMGAVYRARRADGLYEATAAIKFLRGGLAQPAITQRFLAERQILASLAHPAIARLLDGGTADDGSPFIVMELIDGKPIDRYCDDEDLSIAERVHLFLEVTDAVQHAHQALVIHRDIKPSNILVTRQGNPKLLDFGVAKLVGDGDDLETTGLGPLTPAFASPEQLKGLRPTVATDVYSLGLVLYRLLTGRLAFQVVGSTPAEIERRITTEDPPRPSEAAREKRRAASAELKGDLDNILLMSLRKEPERRYRSVEAFAADLRRYLDRLPVAARPATLGYRFGKFVRRHRAAVAGATLLVVGLAAAFGVTLWQARRADRARSVAEAALAQANTVKDFLMSLFRANDPSESRGAEITARELLQRGIQRVDSLAGQPTLQADLLATLAGVEMSLGEYRVAQTLADREVTIRRRIVGEPDSLLVQALDARGAALERLGNPDSAAAVFEEAVALGRRTLGENHPLVLTALNNLANQYARLGRDSAAEAVLRDVITIQRRALAPDAPDRVAPLNDLGLHLVIQGRYSEGVPLLREALRIALVSDTGAQDPATAFSLDNLGMALREAGEYDEAEPLLRRGLALRLKTLGPRHRFMGDSYFSLGLLLALRGRGDDFAESDSLLHASLDVFRATLGPKHRAVAYALYALGVLALHRGDAPAAEGWLRQALAIRRSTTGDAPRETARTLVWLGEAQLAREETAALATMQEADSLAAATLDPLDPVRSRAAIGLALALARRGDSARAAPMYLRAVTNLAGRIGDRHPFVRTACVEGRAARLDGGTACETAQSSADTR